ncbi:MAG TPA: antibiotic biosynthesis monooxygenase family protein [Dehalococcoidia bacterium]|nr:antibiotic biosynthesis monooxygenase family protein [Dehalococcoidia bacterium]
MTTNPRTEAVSALKAPGLRFRIDRMSVPEAARDEFLRTMHRNLDFVETLPGFLGHVVFEKTTGPTEFNFTTIAAWESEAAIREAVARVRSYYEQIGFDIAALTARLGIRVEMGEFQAPAGLQKSP